MRPLSPGRFNALLNPDSGMGQHMSWRRAAFCPCRDLLSGSPTLGCPACAARGVIWGTSVPAWAGITGMKASREWAANTLWESGDVVVSIPEASPLFGAGENDRVLMKDASEPFSVAITPDQTGPLAFNAFEIDRAFWLDTNGAIVGAPSLPSVAPDGSLIWNTGAAPPGGTQFSLTGRKRPEYFVFRDFPRDRSHFGGLRLPRMVILRKFDLMGR